MQEVQDDVLLKDMESHTLSQDEIEECVSTIIMVVWDDCNGILHELKYEETWVDYIYEALCHVLPDEFDYYEDEIIDRTIEQLEEMIIPRSDKNHERVICSSEIEHRIEELRKRNASLPKQRTEEWYNLRHNILSASSIWKVLHTPSSLNQYIYDKCKDYEKKGGVNIHSPLHWGVRYEPLAQMYYEDEFHTKIEEYGCLPHATYTFLGASPDGINVDKTNTTRYGRLLEIKCIVNREITGIPKKEYWIQMQMQMECCNIDQCDFLECRFKEYENETTFLEDSMDAENVMLSKKGQRKGIILVFQENNNPLYEYMPLTCKTMKEFEEWQERIMKKHELLTWTNHIYWYLDQVSCVLVERNTIWFWQHLDTFRDVFHMIQKEKKDNSYMLRKPKPRAKPKENLIVID